MNSMRVKLEREATGIEGIDEMIQGGFPTGSIIGVSGAPGVGKSILNLHFILEGARRGQKSVYINLEESRWNIDNMLLEFGFGKEFLDFEKKGLIIVKCLDYDKYEKVQADLFEHIRNNLEIKRLVVDSFNCFFTASADSCGSTEVSARKMIMEIFYNLRREGLTTILTLERDSEINGANYNVPYLVDGLVNLDYLDLGTIERRIFIPKMRWTDQCKEGRNYNISYAGINVLEDS